MKKLLPLNEKREDLLIRLLEAGYDVDDLGFSADEREEFLLIQEEIEGLDDISEELDFNE